MRLNSPICFAPISAISAEPVLVLAFVGVVVDFRFEMSRIFT
jgi:hypothetical protein